MALTSSVADSHLFVVLVSLVLVYFLWMDLALYYKLQSGYDDLLAVQVYQEDNATAALPDTPVMAYYDPFSPISVKLLMLDHLNHYIYYPACWWLDTHLMHISDRLLFISPDAISLSHVAVAALGARLVVSESLTHRRAGVILFELRSMLDSYDGMVARARSHTKAMAQVSGSWGYWMDGICDAVGTCLFFAACWVLLQRRHVLPNGARPNKSAKASTQGDAETGLALGSRSNSAEDLFAISSSSNPCGDETAPFISRPGSPTSAATAGPSLAGQLLRISSITMLALLAQQFFSSLFWNRYMQGFHQLLEVPYKSVQERAKDFQVTTLKSSPFWIISWWWKLMNPHAQMSLLLCFVFFDVAGVAFLRLRYLGFIPLVVLVACSETFMQSIMWHSLTA